MIYVLGVNSIANSRSSGKVLYVSDDMEYSGI